MMLNNNDMNYKRFVVTELKVCYSKTVKKFPEELGVFPFYLLWLSSRQSIYFHAYKIIIKYFESNRNQKQLRSTNTMSISLTEFRKETDGMYFQYY